MMTRSLFLLSLAFCSVALTHAQVPPSSSFNPRLETDTIHIGDSDVLAEVHGQVLMENKEGKLVPAPTGVRIRSGAWLLVRKGAWFVIGTTTFGPEHHGDRQVRFVSTARNAATTRAPNLAEANAEVHILQPSTQTEGNCTLIQGSRGPITKCEKR